MAVVIHIDRTNGREKQPHDKEKFKISNIVIASQNRMQQMVYIDHYTPHQKVIQIGGHLIEGIEFVIEITAAGFHRIDQQWEESCEFDGTNKQVTNEIEDNDQAQQL